MYCRNILVVARLKYIEKFFLNSKFHLQKWNFEFKTINKTSISIVPKINKSFDKYIEAYIRFFFSFLASLI